VAAVYAGVAFTTSPPIPLSVERRGGIRQLAEGERFLGRIVNLACDLLIATVGKM